MADNTIARQTVVRERLAKNLKLFRGKQSMSQEALGDRAGLHRTQVNRIEQGLVNVMLDTIVSLAEALGVDEIQLLTVHDELPTPLKAGPKMDTEKTAPRKPRRRPV